MSNWADEIGRKVFVTLPWGMTRAEHTTGTIERLTKTLIVVKLEDGSERRFKRLGVLGDYPYRQEQGSGSRTRNALLARDELNKEEGK